MKMHRMLSGFVLALLASFILSPLSAHAVNGTGQEGTTAVPWMQPPPEFKEMQRKGFHAGVQAAIKDYDHHRDPDLERHKEYVHPKVDRSFVPDYRDGYRRGYNDALKHLARTHGKAS
jgi:hypothetical protein